MIAVAMLATALWIARSDQEVPRDIPDYNLPGNIDGKYFGLKEGEQKWTDERM